MSHITDIIVRKTTKGDFEPKGFKIVKQDTGKTATSLLQTTETAQKQTSKYLEWYMEKALENFRLMFGDKELQKTDVELVAEQVGSYVNTAIQQAVRQITPTIKQNHSQQSLQVLALKLRKNTANNKLDKG
jgi:hypothetical protein